MVQFIQTNLVLILTLLFALGSIFGAIVNNKKKELFASIVAAIDAAENLEKTNPEKFQWVLDNTYGALPGIFKLFISELQVSMAIQYVFTKIKAYAKQQTETLTLSAKVATDDAIKACPTLDGLAEAIAAKNISIPVDSSQNNHTL